MVYRMRYRIHKLNKVKVIDTGEQYTTYIDLAEHLGLTKYEDDIYVDNTKRYTFKRYTEHLTFVGEKIAIIEDDYYEYIIGVDGIEFIL